MRQPGLAVAFAWMLGACGGDPHPVVDAAVDGTGGDGVVVTDDAAVDASGLDATADGPDGDATAIDAPASDAAAIDAPDLDAPAIDAPDLDAAVDAPDLDAPIDAPAIDAPPPIDAAPVQQTFYWADWTAATAGAPGSAAGRFDAPSGVVTFTYAGAVAFAQTAGGTNYFVPGAPYINAVTANSPPVPDIIAIDASAVTNTVTFDPPVTGLVMAVVSLGAPGNTVRYDFDRPIALLSYGAGYWGNGTLFVENDHTLAGTEGHGAIQFAGTVSTLSWTVIGGEYWHGYTLGIPAQ